MQTTGCVRYRILIFGGLIALTMALSACQAIAQRTPTPSLPPILLTTQGTSPASARPAGRLPSATAVSALPTTALASPATATPTLPLPPTAGGIMALGVQATVTLRSQPAGGGIVIAQVPGSQVLWAHGRNTDGTWLWVTYNDSGRHAWVSAREIKLLGDPSALPDLISVTGTAATVATTAPATPSPTTAPIALAPTTATAAQLIPAATSLPAPAPTRLPIRPPAGKIAFQTAIGGDIYLVNADGTGLRRLTNGFDPALSPDGTQLAFVRWGSPDGLYVLDLHTGQERCLATPKQPRGPAWSPDGTKIVISHSTLQTTCLDTPFGCLSQAEVYNLFAGRDCIGTPQGRFCIADFQWRNIDLTDLALVTVADGGWMDLASQRRSQTPSWHPKRNEVLYTGRTGLQLITIGEVTRPLVDDVTLSSASWSPDGQRIVAQAHKHDHWDIVLLDAAGNIVAQLTRPDPLSSQRPNNVAPAWSPDGKTILFLSDRDGSWRVYRMNADGSGQAPFLPHVLGKIVFSYNYAAERVLSWSQ
ncbi:MAG: hypothetical protein ACUVS6_07000 [Anaerolineae bacterium]